MNPVTSLQRPAPRLSRKSLPPRARRVQSRRITASGLVIVASILALTGCAPAETVCPADAAPDTRDGRWRSDLACVSDTIERLHPDPFTRVSAAEFRQQVNDLDRTIPQLTDAAIRVRLLALTATLGDGNTRLKLPDRPLAVEFERFPEGIYVVAARSSQQFLLGRRVVGLGSEPIDTVRAGLAGLVPAENSSSFAAREADLLRSVEVLQGFGLVGATGVANLVAETTGGTREETLIQPLGNDTQLVRWPENRPRSLQRRHLAYWCEVDTARSTVYFQYNQASSRSDLPMSAAADAVLQALTDGRAARLVLDMRFNDTGSAATLQPLLDVIAGWPGRRDPARFKLLVGPRTYAGALENAVRLSQTAAVEIIGEAPGGNPNHFAGTVSEVLPYSGLSLSVSTQPVRLTQDASNRLRVDRRITWSVADYARGVDPVLVAAGL